MSDIDLLWQCIFMGALLVSAELLQGRLWHMIAEMSRTIFEVQKQNAVLVAMLDNSASASARDEQKLKELTRE